MLLRKRMGSGFDNLPFGTGEDLILTMLLKLACLTDACSPTGSRFAVPSG